MPTNITDDPTSFPAVTSPAGSEVPNAASLQTSVQQLANRTAYLKSLGFLGQIKEGFESTTFPPPTPAGAWSAPSIRYPTDAAYVRDTSNPLFGSASANYPAAQATNSFSSLGFTGIYFATPSRVAFLFDVLGNSGSNRDVLNFYIDGVQVAAFASTDGVTRVSGRYMSAILREGFHNLDWRWSRGPNSAVSGSKARIDDVEVLPESVWGDRLNGRISYIEEFRGTSAGLWTASNSGNAGTVTYGSSAGQNLSGMVLTSAAVAVGDWEAITFNGDALINGANGACLFLETTLLLPNVISGMFCELGFWAGPTNTGWYVSLVYDSSVATTWFLKVSENGTSTSYNTGITALNASWINFSLSYTGYNQVNFPGVVATIANLAVAPAGASSYSFACGSNYPFTKSVTPYFRVGSRTSAAAKTITVDFARYLFDWAFPYN